MIAFLLATLLACGPHLGGQWEGSCSGVSPDGVFAVPFVVHFDGDQGHGRFGYNGYTFKGDAWSERDGSDVSIDLDGVAGGYLITLSVIGMIDGNDITGDCSFLDLQGSVEMSR